MACLLVLWWCDWCLVLVSVLSTMTVLACLASGTARGEEDDEQEASGEVCAVAVTRVGFWLEWECGACLTLSEPSPGKAKVRVDAGVHCLSKAGSKFEAGIVIGKCPKIYEGFVYELV
jgi:hypothetical protein